MIALDSSRAAVNQSFHAEYSPSRRVRIAKWHDFFRRYTRSTKWVFRLRDLKIRCVCPKMAAPCVWMTSLDSLRTRWAGTALLMLLLLFGYYFFCWNRIASTQECEWRVLQQMRTRAGQRVTVSIERHSFVRYQFTRRLKHLSNQVE